MNIRLSRMRTGVLAVGAALTLGLAGCSSGTPSSTSGGGSGAPTDGTLTVGLLGDIGQPPDPDIYYANNGTAIMINAYEGLVQYKNNTDKVEIAPRLAESWDVNPTHDVYTFHLRQGVTFHDGTPFTSAAVDVAFKRRIAVKGGAAYMVEAVKSVATPDDHTAVITLNQPNTAFLSYLASPFGPKMESPEGLKANAGADDAQTYLSSHDLGTGPYMLTTAQTGVKYELTQYDGYWGPKSPFKKVELPVYTDESALELAFDNGTVDTIVAALPSSSLDKYASKDGVSNYFLPTLQGSMVTVNSSHDFFKTPEARVAFLTSIDQAALVKQVLGERSSVATTMYAKGMIQGATDKQAISFDADVLKKYVDRCLPTPTRPGDRVCQRQSQCPVDGQYRHREAADAQDLGDRAGLRDLDRCSVGSTTRPRGRTRSSTVTTAPTAATPTCGATCSGTPPVGSTTSSASPRPSTACSNDGHDGRQRDLRQGGRPVRATGAS